MEHCPSLKKIGQEQEEDNKASNGRGLEGK